MEVLNYKEVLEKELENDYLILPSNHEGVYIKKSDIKSVNNIELIEPHLIKISFNNDELVTISSQYTEVITKKVLDYWREIQK